MKTQPKHQLPTVSKRREKKRLKRDLGKNSLKGPRLSRMRLLFLSAVLVSFFSASFAASDDDDESAPRLYTINGKVHPPAVHTSVPSDPDWFWRTKVVVDGGKRQEQIDIIISCQAPTHDYRAYRIYCVLYVNFSRSGFLREDGTFAVSGLPTGSYVVEVVNADYYYEPVRVDINSKGKMRARKVNNVQPTQVKQCCFFSYV